MNLGALINININNNNSTVSNPVQEKPEKKSNLVEKNKAFTKNLEDTSIENEKKGQKIEESKVAAAENKKGEEKNRINENLTKQAIGDIPNSSSIGSGIDTESNLQNQKELEMISETLDSELGIEELQNLLSAIATGSLEGTAGVDIDASELEKLMEQMKQLQEIFTELQTMMKNNEHPLSNQFPDINDSINLLVNLEEGTNIKEMSKFIDGIKNTLFDLKEVSNGLQFETKLREVISKVIEIERSVDKLAFDKNVSIQSETIQIIKTENVVTNDKTNNQSAIIEEISVETIKTETIKDTESTKVMDEELIIEQDNVEHSGSTNVNRSEMSVNEKIDSKVSKNTEMNLEQLRSKVHDKLEQIEKMTISKDRIYVNLNPKNLGNVEVLFRKSAEGIEVAIEFDEKKSKQALESLFDDLRREFKEKNIEFSFVFKEKNREENSERKNESSKQEGNIENENTEDSEETFEEIMERVLRGD